MAEPTPTWTLDTEDKGDLLVGRLGGTLDRGTAKEFVRGTKPLLKVRKPLELSLAAVESIDSVGASALACLADNATAAGLQVRFVEVPERVRSLLEGFPALEEGVEMERQGALLRLGGWGAGFGRGLVLSLAFVAEAVVGMVVGLFVRRGRRKGAVSDEIFSLGAEAVPVVTVIGALLGLILAFQASYQLRTFGASIYVANLVGVSALRELAPLLTAVVVSGRSGSAIAAEIGTMKVGEELAALEVMGIEPIRYLVVPRMLAVTFTQPFLTAIAALVTIMAGMAIGVLYMGLGFDAYLNQTLRALHLKDLIHGLGKSVVFGWLIVLIGSYMGLQVKPSAEAVGQAATRAVVASIFALIVADGLITTVNTLLL